MRNKLALALVVLFMAAFTVTMFAGTEQPMTYPTKTIAFHDSFVVGGKTLPGGEYRIRHIMENGQHVMYFRNLDKPDLAEVRITCSMVTIAEKAPRTEQYYKTSDKGEKVLQALIFKGDKVKHEF